MVGYPLKLEADAERVSTLVDSILAISNLEKEALGFLPQAAYHDAASQGRMMVAQVGEEVAGFILFGGVFPHARVQQVGVSQPHRRRGVATFLMKSLIERLEQAGFLTIKARVASDLPAAQQFYAKMGFEEAQTVAGGEARQRNIVVRVRHLESPSLLDAAGVAIDWSSKNASIALRRSPPGEAPFYAIDLNVLFDLVRDRQRSEDAHQLFSAALAHTLRIAAAGEFVAELLRTTPDRTNDPLLRLASQLPRLPRVDDASVAALAATFHAAVFESPPSKSAGSPQARSDCRHLAHATLAGAAGFITSDHQLLAKREELRASHGIDIASLDELVSLLPIEGPSPPPTAGLGFECQCLTPNDAEHHLRALGASVEMLAQFCAPTGLNNRGERYGIFENGRLLAVGILQLPRTLDTAAQLLIQVPQNHSLSDQFADHLFDVLLRQATLTGAAGLELRRLPGQTLVSRVAEARGFFESGGSHSKIALGGPLTSSNWEQASNQIRRRVGIEIINPNMKSKCADIRDSAGSIHSVTFERLEDILSPAILSWPEREGVIVSIKKLFADELLGTSTQGTLAFVEARSAAFLARRAYVSSPRNAGVVRASRPILFYESERSGGRGAIVAAARVVDVLLQSKTAVSPDSKRRLVVDEVDPFSSSDDVLVTTFDNILRFPKPFSRRELERINALGTNNLQAATAISGENLQKVLDAAWSHA